MDFLWNWDEMATLTTRDDRQASTEPASLLGRDELNLAEFPITLLADYAPKGEKTLTFRGGNGRLTVTGSDAYGLPTALDADVIVALIYLTKLRNDFQDVKVNFSRYELIKLLNWPDKGSSYTRLDQALNRWVGVLLVYDKCWWNNKTKRYASAKMHILESVVITEPGQMRAGPIAPAPIHLHLEQDLHRELPGRQPAPARPRHLFLAQERRLQAALPLPRQAVLPAGRLDVRPR